MQTGTSTYQVNKHYLLHTLLVGVIISICNIFRDHYSSILFHAAYQLNLITDDVTDAALIVARHVAATVAVVRHQSQNVLTQLHR